MKILFSSYAYPNALRPNLGTFNRSMIAGLARDHAVRVVAPVPFLLSRKLQQVSHHFEAVSGVVAEYPAFYYTPKILRKHYHRFLWYSIQETLHRAISEFQPDIMLSYWAHPDGTVAVQAARQHGLPVAVMVGGSDVLVIGRGGGRRPIILDTLQSANRVIAVSQDIAETIQRDGIPQDQVAVVARGVDFDTFTPGDRQQARERLGLPSHAEILIGVGRLVPVKGWPSWIEACHQVRLRGRPVQAYILGAGELESSLQRQIQSLDLQDHVRVMGSQTQTQLADWYRAANLTVLSSVSEGVPNVLLETIACGGSFVATRVGGVPEIADVDYDRVVIPESPTALALAIIDRLDHPPLCGLARRFQPASLAEASQRLASTLEDAISHHWAKRGAVPQQQAALSHVG